MRAAVVLGALLAACASAGRPTELDAARAADDQALAAQAAEIDAPKHAAEFLVVANGQIAGSAGKPEDALRLAEKTAPAAKHRYVFRPSDRGERLHRMAFVADGGIVAGRRFLADLGVVGTRPSSRATIELATLDGASHRTVEAVLDSDFDGGLLVTADVASSLGLARFEIPGAADVQVAMGHPFRALRAWVQASVPSLRAAGRVEAIWPGR